MKKKLHIVLMALFFFFMTAKATSSQEVMCSQRMNEITDDVKELGFFLALDGEYAGDKGLLKIFINPKIDQLIIITVNKETGQECILTTVQNLHFHSIPKPPKL